MTGDSPERSSDDAADVGRGPIDEPTPPTAGDAPAGGDDSADAAATRRRIAIGTQRPGVAPPRLPPRHQFVTSPAQPRATDAAPGAAPVEAAAGPATPLAEGGPAVPDAPASGAGEVGTGGAGEPAVRGPAPGGRGEPRPGGGRPRRPQREPSAFDIQRPTKRVAPPSLRGPLEDDLEADFAAAMEGIAVDDVLARAPADKVEAPLEPGTRVSGTVVSFGPDTAFLDLGGRRQGALKLAGIEPVPEVGAVLELSVGGRNEDDGLYDVAPANRAVAVEDWSQLEAGMVVAARVTGANKGGLECDVAGLRGFMPASLVSTWRIENLEELVGQTLESLVTEIVPAARRLVLSRRAVIERQAADARTKLLESLAVGDVREGVVRSVRDFGAFVDIGDGVDGLVHVSQMSWDRVAKPEDFLQPGQKVRVVVKKIDAQTGKIGLSIRETAESPWKTAAERFPIGSTVRGAVTRIAQFGAFVRLAPGIEGLVHVSELAHRHVRSVGDVVKEGETVECRVLAVDPDEQRLSLSIKALAALAQPATAAAAAEPEVEEEPPPPPVKQSNKPLKGGLGGGSAGDRFGLQW
ncbi:MAG: S1 RNA-binding domain-containing protein [Planctomycetota bacterium]